MWTIMNVRVQTHFQKTSLECWTTRNTVVLYYNINCIKVCTTVNDVNGTVKYRTGDYGTDYYGTFLIRFQFLEIWGSNLNFSNQL